MSFNSSPISRRFSYCCLSSSWPDGRCRPGLDAFFHPLLDFFGGRQSARTIHFIAACFIVLFTIIHVVMVLLSGVFNNLRSMITGRYDIGSERQAHAE